mmetsp:Transcript_8359/g.17897  ORF Transcript_8359/g.17897 Transcript_8359/m.17897 type:complete len:167 (+) Transcript_8359:276-776(+)|eukprot:CAMPEP_0202921888 /NCGR_PEP_ID=MMETSP1392-20130828/77634_1 /ASSEMBLY_ACC=CAM_ASM_000868 /TAXON_ID=225041 /ORGANISM="Chlamydomonas chlamydogama, Strain SAG 11-48b" /LENGTH=166 /DNA_ID=CAMNT_0049615489 /DNA_START=208 /DNA_END=708 /DNA_ORIENTATION=-
MSGNNACIVELISQTRETRLSRAASCPSVRSSEASVCSVSNSLARSGSSYPPTVFFASKTVLAPVQVSLNLIPPGCPGCLAPLDKRDLTFATQHGFRAHFGFCGPCGQVMREQQHMGTLYCLYCAHGPSVESILEVKPGASLKLMPADSAATAMERSKSSGYILQS